jgi:hypothetical protein
VLRELVLPQTHELHPRVPQLPPHPQFLPDDGGPRRVVVLADVEDGRHFECPAVLSLPNSVFYLVVVLEVEAAVVDAAQEVFPLNVVAGGEFGGLRVEGAGPFGDDSCIAVDVVADARPVHLDGLEQPPVFLLVLAEPIEEDVDLAVLDDVDAFLPQRLQQLFLGRVERLLEAAGHAGLHLLGPAAEEEDAGLDDGQRLIAHHHVAQLLVELRQQVVLVLGRQLGHCALVGHQVPLGAADQTPLQAVVALHLVERYQVLLEVLLFGADGRQRVSDLVDEEPEDNDSFVIEKIPKNSTSMTTMTSVLFLGVMSP